MKLKWKICSLSFELTCSTPGSERVNGILLLLPHKQNQYYHTVVVLMWMEPLLNKHDTATMHTSDWRTAPTRLGSTQGIKIYWLDYLALPLSRYVPKRLPLFASFPRCILLVYTGDLLFRRQDYTKCQITVWMIEILQTLIHCRFLHPTCNE